MNAVIWQLAEHGWLILAVTTSLLAVGCALMCVTRSPAHRQRTAELTLLVLLAWLALACCPLPRWNWNRDQSPASLGKAVRLMAAADAPREEAVAEDAVEWRLTDDVAQLEMAKSRSPALRANTSKSTAESLGRIAANIPPEDARRPDASAPGASRPRAADEPVVEIAPMATVGPATSIEPGADGRWWLAVEYVAGALGCLVWLICGRLALLRIRRTSRRPPEWLAALFASLPGGEGPARPLLLVGRRCARPMSWGVRRSVIVLPARLVRRRNLAQLRAVLLHELAHVARRDIRGDLLVCLALPMLYFHPLFWWLRSQLRLATELLADDRAARQAGKLAYVEHLVAVARSLRGGGNTWPLATTQATTLYASHTQFYRRMQMLLARKVQLCQRPSFVWRLSSLVAACMVIVLVAATAGIQPAAGQAEEAAPAAQDSIEAPPDAPAGERKAQDATTAPQQPAPSGDAADNRPKLPKARENLQQAEVDRLLAEREILKAQIEATRAQINALTSQMEELKARPADARAKLAGAGAVETPHVLDLTRINEDGSISSEIWSTDAEGRPKEMLGKRLDKSPDESPWRITTVTGDDEVVKEFEAEDGTRLRYVYDAGTGRLISRKFFRGREAPPRANGSAARGSLKIGEKLRASAMRNAELMKSQGGKIDGRAGAGDTSGNPTPAGRSPADLDLVGLVTAYSDALADTDKAKAALSEVPESRAVRAAVRSAERKQRFLKMFVEEAANTAKSNLEYSRKMASRGYVTAESVANAEFRLRILTDILNAESDTHSH